MYGIFSATGKAFLFTGMSCGAGAAGWIVIALICLRLLFCSYAEMEATQKNAISHRGRALQKLRDYLQAPGVGSA